MKETPFELSSFYIKVQTTKSTAESNRILCIAKILSRKTAESLEVGAGVSIRNPSFSYFYIALSNRKIWTVSLHLIHPLIFECHPGKSPPQVE